VWERKKIENKMLKDKKISEFFKKIVNKVGNYEFCKSLYLYQIGLDFPFIPLQILKLKYRFLNFSHCVAITKSIMSSAH